MNKGAAYTYFSKRVMINSYTEIGRLYGRALTSSVEKLPGGNRKSQCIDVLVIMSPSRGAAVSEARSIYDPQFRYVAGQKAVADSNMLGKYGSVDKNRGLIGIYWRAKDEMCEAWFRVHEGDLLAAASSVLGVLGRLLSSPRRQSRPEM